MAVGAAWLSCFTVPVPASPPDDWCDVCSPYGDGSNGNVTITGHVDLSDDMDYRNLTIDPGATLDTQGYTVRVCERLWVKSGGKITDTYSGGDGCVGGTPGLGANPNGGSHPPACTFNAGACTSGQASPYCNRAPKKPGGGYGARGGGGGGGGGGAWEEDLVPDADGGDGGAGGGGGKGGGSVRVFAYRFQNNGLIHADGFAGNGGENAPEGDDGDEDSGHYEACGAEYYPWGIVFRHDLSGGGGGGGGGGCGGNGGTVEIYYAEMVSQGEIRANGGQGGYGGLGGTRGGCLLYGADGGHDANGCAGGAGCGPYNCGRGGTGGRGAHVAADCSAPGGNGNDGCSGATVQPSLTELPYRVCVVRPDGSGDYPTIQDAIDADPPCAIIELTDGVFEGPGNRDLDFGGQDLVVRSQSGDPESCIIDCDYAGRGFYFYTGETACAVVEGITIRRGRESEGGGICCIGASPTIRDCSILDCDAAEAVGAGVYASEGSPSISDCTIAGCGWLGGAALEFEGGDPTVTGCQVTGNLYGGMLFRFVASATVSSCTVAGNGSGTFAGGLAFYVCGAAPHVSNSVVWGNCGPQIWYGGIVPPPPAPVVSCCDVEGGWPGTNNIDADPLFCDPEPCENAPTTAGNYGLKPGSPCLPENQPACGLIGALDVGCECTWTVYPDGSGYYPTIQDAINAAIDYEWQGWVICLADGTFRGAGNRDISWPGPNKAITVRSLNGPENCTIDCWLSRISPHRGFYFHSGVGPDAVLEGVTISNGNEFMSGSCGGAILCVDASPTITDCRIIGNSAYDGGGICCESGASPTISQCVIAGNKAWGDGGGGLYTLSSSPEITSCTISANRAEQLGGGVYQSGGHPEFWRTILWGNCAAGPGSGDEWYGNGGWRDFCCGDLRMAGVDGDWNGVRMCLAGYGNLDADPLFCDPTCCDTAPTVGGDYRLDPDSPCVDHDQCGLVGAVGVASPPCEADCQPNGTSDKWDICSGTSQDCQPNGIPDECDIADCPPGDPDCADCQPNGVPDWCDIYSGTSQDSNINGVPDECECSAAAVRSCRNHAGAGRLCLDMGLTGGIEPRLGGIQQLDITLDDASGFTPGATVTYDCGSCGSGTASAVANGNVITVSSFSPALPDKCCCTVTLNCDDGAGSGEVCVCGLQGDIDRGGLVTPGDASIIKPHFGETPDDGTCQYDYDVSGVITPGDFSQVKSRFANDLPPAGPGYSCPSP